MPSWAEEMSCCVDCSLPLQKISFGSQVQDESLDPPSKGRQVVVLVSTGSFNPPTYMHLRLFAGKRCIDLRRILCDWRLYVTCKCAYKKRGLLSAEHRIAMCNVACESSEDIMVDTWEANQSTHQRTLTVLSRIRSVLCENQLLPCESLKVMLVCGLDLVESVGIPAVWIREQVATICRDYGVVCICRKGQEIEQIISTDEILTQYKSNIKIVDDVVPNGISSTIIRDCISKVLTVKYLTADEVINYIKKHNLYLDS